jgi:hypothetical protein
VLDFRDCEVRARVTGAPDVESETFYAARDEAETGWGRPFNQT